MGYKRIVLALALAGLQVLSAGAQIRAVTASDELLGLWGGEALLGPLVRGDIILQCRARRCTARVAGFEATAEQSGDSLILPLPGGQGTLRAWVHHESIDGFWVQPGTDERAPYATPIHFHVAGEGLWRGVVVPLDDRFLLYLWVSHGPDGSLRGIFRNPEVNWPGRAGAYGIERHGDTLAFRDSRTGQVRYRQLYDSANHTILFDFGGPIVLTPRTPEQAIGFFPRAASLPEYAYRVPVPQSDGWRTGRAAAAGFDESALQAIVRRLAKNDPLSDTTPRVHSLLIARRGSLVLEEYFYGYGPDRPHDLRSASKTMTSVMAGVAMHRGARFGVSSRVDSSDLALPPITVGHLLTHTSGLACNDDDDKSPGNEDVMQSQHAEINWYRYVLALPRVRAPGLTYSYCSGGINLVGQVIGQATHQWLPAFFDQFIAQPMHISNYAVNLMPTGEAYSGGGMHMLSRDFLKFGQLYLNGGTWNGTRLVSAAWAAQSTARQVDRPDGSSDGFGWHRHLLQVGGRALETYEASGNGGQILIVIPALDVTIAVTAGNYGQYGVWQRIREVLVPQVLLAAH